MVWCASIVLVEIQIFPTVSRGVWPVRLREVGGVIRGTREWTTSNTITNYMYVMISIDPMSPQCWLS